MLNSSSQFGILENLHLYTLQYSISTSELTESLQRYSNATLIFYWGWLAGYMNTADHLYIRAKCTSTPHRMDDPETADWKLDRKCPNKCQ